MASEEAAVQIKLFQPFAWAKRPLNSQSFSAFQEAARKTSNQARSVLRSKTISYGPTSEQRLEWFSVKDSKTVLVYIHGGAWRSGDVASSAFMAVEMAKKGVDTVVLGFDVCPQVTLKALASQVCRAFDVVLENVRTECRIFVGGISSGAHLAATLLAHLPEEPRVSGYVLLGGLYDLRPLLSLPFNDDLQMTPEDAQTLSPVLAAVLSGPAKILVTVGTDDSPAFIDQAATFSEKLRKSGRDVIERREENFDHLHLSEDFLRDDSLLLQTIFAFMAV